MDSQGSPDATERRCRNLIKADDSAAPMILGSCYQRASELQRMEPRQCVCSPSSESVWVRRTRCAQPYPRKRLSPRPLLGLLASLYAVPAAAVLIPFENCLDSGYIYTNVPADEVPLQWVPQFVDARFDMEDPAHNLLVTVWGNVTGKAGDEQLPAWNDPLWNDDSYTNGKIVDVPNMDGPEEDRIATTLLSRVNVLTYIPWTHRDNFCNSILNESCPITPIFNTSVLYASSPLQRFYQSISFR